MTQIRADVTALTDSNRKGNGSQQTGPTYTQNRRHAAVFHRNRN
jgi:hypothetical protein